MIGCKTILTHVERYYNFFKEMDLNIDDEMEQMAKVPSENAVEGMVLQKGSLYNLSSILKLYQVEN
jgi:hypothetical protein